MENQPKKRTATQASILDLFNEPSKRVKLDSTNKSSETHEQEKGEKQNNPEAALKDLIKSPDR